MYKKSHIIAAILIFNIFAAAQILIDDRNVTVSTAADVAAKRQALINYVWGPNATLPLTALPQLPVIRNDISPIPNLTDLDHVDTLTVEMEHGIKSYAHHFVPLWSNHRLVILHHGHAVTFNDSAESADVSYGMRRTIEGLLGDGYSVLAVYMPRQADFTTSITVHDDGGPLPHNDFFYRDDLKPATGSPMKYFLEPLTAYINFLSTRSSTDGFPVYSDFSMVGFSGGGWTTTVYSALDTRIKLSISVAGSMPLYLRAGGSIGDIEQRLPEFYSIAGYPDLYVLGSDGPGRRQIQIVNRGDSCCFGAYEFEPSLANGMTYDEALRDYETRVRTTLAGLGDKEIFSLQIDEAAPSHMVTWDAIYDTILPYLNQGRRYVGTAFGDQAVARGVDGYPQISINGNWSPAKLAPMIGTPALLRGAASINEMFYLSPSNQLAFVSRRRYAWSRGMLINPAIISDPAAISRAAGSFDVVAQKNDYELYHFHSEAGVITSERVSELVKGIGQPTLLSSSPDQLDLFYRSWNRKLYYGRKTGNSPWVIQEVGGRMKSLPTAVRRNDGRLIAFVRGLDSGLWAAIREPGDTGAWGSWASISGLVGAPTISGSPSASIQNGVITVAARTPTGRLVLFSFDDDWSFVVQDANIIGSPTATPSGIFFRNTDAALAFYNGVSITSLGGKLD